ncbi:MAG: allophanate hydrolase subunit 1 [Actinobacteria bacterium]|nr:allophanate hydrolase subunit 1 [Actinomycetota bacterium]
MNGENSAIESVTSYGTDAYLVRARDPDDVANLLAAIDERAPEHPALREAHAGERSILVRFDPAGTGAREIGDLLARLTPRHQPNANSTITLPVRYDGPDLAIVADAANLSAEAVVAMHQQATYRVAFCGFAPGFAYLTGLPEQLHLPRRDSPRTLVPQGSVAIAAHYCAVYPSSSPGGWLLIGTCATTLFDPAAAPPALLAPGTTVTFEATT